MSDLHIKGGRLIDPKKRVDAKLDVFVSGGKIAALGKAPSGFHAERTIDASGLVVCPGLIDLSARLREPGFEYKATLESEMQAAVAGGVTSLACPPDTDPPLDEPGLVEMLKYRARSLNLVHVYPLGALTAKLAGERLTERELEVLRLVTSGLRNKEIAARLGVSENTAKFHLRNILEKLHAGSRTELATRALREGLVGPEPPGDGPREAGR